MYSTQLPKKAAGAFTSNHYINNTSTVATNNNDNNNIVNKTLVYIGPFSETIRRYKMTASLFSICGICAVPALLSTGQAPVISVALDMWLGIETWTFFGRKKENNMWLSQLRDISTPKAMRWQFGKEKFTVERGIVDADPFLKRLATFSMDKKQI
ncbi:uncharacterized protein BX664DRAFT_257241 [Halteromyces radiatus]|uniref:uncharacterized protein n=1 Tax=Halteromyces radiatus TaxID=101107 RepID=UPI002220AD49|nr:uncharacterized protein BX664DRAFT_257241 [Halteromyces radiatus]KAI8096937.1 hypothetical protein BX664DRAFT_257241 [Halteromyces radiatus]